jgi:hypothetical protein
MLDDILKYYNTKLDKEQKKLITELKLRYNINISDNLVTLVEKHGAIKQVVTQYKSKILNNINLTNEIINKINVL